MQYSVNLGAGMPEVCRLGLATRGGSRLRPTDAEFAIARGLNYLNWCGYRDALSQTIAALGPERSKVVVAVQFESRAGADAVREFDYISNQLRTGYIDIATLYYVESEEEWQQIISPDGAMEHLLAQKQAGRLHSIGLTSHQRPLAARVAETGLLDLLMIRYNAAHRGAETDVFPVTDALGMPVVVYTCLRWGALLRPTPDDPPGFAVPPAPAWYRFALQSPSVAVALMAPENREELDEDLTVLDGSMPLTPEEFALLEEHGRRVRRHAGSFP